MFVRDLDGKTGAYGAVSALTTGLDGMGFSALATGSGQMGAR